MSRDPLLILHAVRQRGVETARRALGAHLHAEVEVRQRIVRLDHDAEQDAEAAGGIPDSHRFLDIFAARRGAIRAERLTAEADLVGVQERCKEARANVVAARTAAEAVAQLIDEREAIARADAAKREQHTLDDVTRPRRAAHPRPG